MVVLRLYGILANFERLGYGRMGVKWMCRLEAADRGTMVGDIFGLYTSHQRPTALVEAAFSISVSASKAFLGSSSKYSKKLNLLTDLHSFQGQLCANLQFV
jgi:hypothetical protein